MKKRVLASVGMKLLSLHGSANAGNEVLVHGAADYWDWEVEVDEVAGEILELLEVVLLVYREGAVGRERAI